MVWNTSSTGAFLKKKFAMLWIFYLNFEENIKNSVKMMGPNSLIFYYDGYIWI